MGLIFINRLTNAENEEISPSIHSENKHRASNEMIACWNPFGLTSSYRSLDKQSA